MNTEKNREKTIQIMFETFNVASFYIANQSVLSLYSSRRNTGIVVEVGDGVTEIVPIYEDAIISNAIMGINMGGQDISTWLEKNLNQSCCQFNTSAEKEIICDIKENLCYVALNSDDELHQSESTNDCEVSYLLADGLYMTIGNERFRGPEQFFQRRTNGFKFSGIDQMLFDSIMKCERNHQQSLFSNIILSGGTTLLKGFPERIQKEITKLAPSKMKIEIIAKPDRQYDAWIGGSIFASGDTFPRMVISKPDYHNCGPKIFQSQSRTNEI